MRRRARRIGQKPVHDLACSAQNRVWTMSVFRFGEEPHEATPKAFIQMLARAFDLGSDPGNDGHRARPAADGGFKVPGQAVTGEDVTTGSCPAPAPAQELG